MLREIKNIMQRSLVRRKRWFQDDDFDLYVWQAPDGTVLELQLCYERATRRERALTWKRGIGYGNYVVDSGVEQRDTPLLYSGGRFGVGASTRGVRQNDVAGAALPAAFGAG